MEEGPCPIKGPFVLPWDGTRGAKYRQLMGQLQAQAGSTGQLPCHGPVTGQGVVSRGQKRKRGYSLEKSSLKRALGCQAMDAHSWEGRRGRHGLPKDALPRGKVWQLTGDQCKALQKQPAAGTSTGISVPAWGPPYCPCLVGI